MTVDLRDIKAIDVHAHPYLLQSTPMTVVEFVQKLSLSVLPDMFKETNRTNPKIPFPGTNMYMQTIGKRKRTVLISTTRSSTLTKQLSRSAAKLLHCVEALAVRSGNGAWRHAEYGI